MYLQVNKLWNVMECSILNCVILIVYLQVNKLWDITECAILKLYKLVVVQFSGKETNSQTMNVKFDLLNKSLWSLK